MLGFQPQIDVESTDWNELVVQSQTSILKTEILDVILLYCGS